VLFRSVAWYQHPRRAWGIVMGILVAVVFLMSIAGAVVPQPAAQ
jgi:hypothetical protein